MKNNIVKVKLWDITVGYLKWDDSNWKTTSSIFQFDKSFREKGLDIAPLTVPYNSEYIQKGIAFKNGSPKDTFRGLPPFVADSLPDHWGTRIFNAWVKTHLPGQKTNPVDMLSFIGTRGMGALEYVPAIINDEEVPFDVDVNKLYSFAQQILDERSEPTFAADKELLWQDLVKLGTSPGGKRPKALIAINEKDNTVKSGQATLPPGYRYYILKYDNEKDTFPYARMEYIYHLLCCGSEIDMMPCILRPFETATHFLTERFDRINGEKQHMLSLRAMVRGADSYEEAFDAIERLHLDYRDKDQLFRRMVFNVVSGNIDDHDANLSFLMDKNGKWKLSPAYDMIYSIDPSTPDFTKGQFMSVNGKNNQISKTDILTVAHRYGIKNPEHIIEQILDSMSNLETYFNDFRIPAATQKYIKKELNEKYKHLNIPKTFLFRPELPSLTEIKTQARQKNKGEQKTADTTTPKNKYKGPHF